MVSRSISAQSAWRIFRIPLYLMLGCFALLVIAFYIWKNWPDPPANNEQTLTATFIPLEYEKQVGETKIKAVWELSSPNTSFAGFSALILLPEALSEAGSQSAAYPDAVADGTAARTGTSGNILAISDFGTFARFERPEIGLNQLLRMKSNQPLKVAIAPINVPINAPKSDPTNNPISANNSGEKEMVDVESAVYDPIQKLFWLGYEDSNTIERRSTIGSGENAMVHAMVNSSGNSSGNGGYATSTSQRSQAASSIKRVAPEPMAQWNSNAGPEAMVRLKNGQFIILSEGSENWFGDDHPGLLFAGDPVEGAEAVKFLFTPPEGFRPVDMVQIPDGRVLILVRKWTFGVPIRFISQLILADPKEIAPDRNWSGRRIATLQGPVPSDNFEGLAVEPQDNGLLKLWLISDDNRSVMQRTLLMQLIWDPNSQAPSNSPE